MKKIRLFAFLCVLVLAFGSLSFASADSKPAMYTKSSDSKAMAYTYTPSGYTLKNGKSVKFFLMPNYLSNLYYVSNSVNYTVYSAIFFDCDGPVKAKCSASWVHIMNIDGNIILSFDINDTTKNRTATITVTGTNYKAKIKLAQFGASKFTSVVRKKKTVTGKIKLPKGNKGGYITVDDYLYGVGNVGQKAFVIKSGKTSMKFKFKVKVGHEYAVALSTFYPLTKIKPFELYSEEIWFIVNEDNIGNTQVIR